MEDNIENQFKSLIQTQNGAVLRKKGPDDASSDHCSLSSSFTRVKLLRLPTLQVPLMYLTSTKFDKSSTKVIPCNASTTPYEYLSLNDSSSAPAPA